MVFIDPKILKSVVDGMASGKEQETAPEKKTMASEPALRFSSFYSSNSGEYGSNKKSHRLQLNFEETRPTKNDNIGIRIRGVTNYVSDYNPGADGFGDIRITAGPVYKVNDRLQLYSTTGLGLCGQHGIAEINAGIKYSFAEDISINANVLGRTLIGYDAQAISPSITLNYQMGNNMNLFMRGRNDYLSFDSFKGMQYRGTSFEIGAALSLFNLNCEEKAAANRICLRQVIFGR